jgi:SPFH domain/Band 7 family protein
MVDRYSEPDVFSTVKKFAFVAALVIVGIFVLGFGGSLIENVSAQEVVIIQSPVSGKLTCYATPGWRWQGLGSVSSYPKREIYEFETQVRFNDGGHGVLKGSVQYEMPLDCSNLTSLHTRFGSRESIQKQLIEKVVTKSVYMTGPLMSSRESYAEKRNYLINYVEDQIENGVYRTVQRETRVVDQLTGQEKSAMVVDIVMNAGVPVRQEQAVLTPFGIKPFNFAISELVYDETVEKQIQGQQAIAMDVQTAIAEARKAEQRSITVEQQGRADAAKAKWDQEVIKAREVTAAEAALAVQTLGNQTAEQYRQATLKRAEADAGARKQLMQADGALSQKLDAWVKVNGAYADAVKNYKGNWVPGVVTGGGGNGNQNAATDLIDLLRAKTAKELSLEFNAKE